MIARQTFKGYTTSPEARAAFEGRLAALVATQNLLTEQNWKAESLKQIISDGCTNRAARRAGLN